MSIQRPYAISIRGQTIDANDSNLISWQVTGDLSYAYQVRIYNNYDNTLKYDSGKLTSFSISHIVPSASITNGSEYKINITIWNQSGLSITSDSEIFQTSSRPVITIPPIPLITSPSYLFSANYVQAENSPSRSWIVYLYNDEKVKIAESNISTKSPIEYIFSELQSNVSYYVEFQVTSVKGLTGTSGLVKFTVSYTQPNIKLNLTAENTDDAGIKISWKTIQVLGKTKSAPFFINGEELDLRNNVFFLDDISMFNIEDDFTLKMWFRDMVLNQSLIVLKSNNGSMTLLYSDKDNRFHLFKEQSNFKSHYVSNSLQGNSFFVCIQQISGDMNIVATLYNDDSDHTARINNLQLYSDSILGGDDITPNIALDA
ncbi:hypothetical protein [Paenibacillus spiritus]|uniref:hypothetical protein n=1 Tax=Paenibacillus spiritus TaxID=2496557 RepID=UPI00168B755F|nr:hypothetical protein [Paenibacillus spiritus]